MAETGVETDFEMRLNQISFLNPAKFVHAKQRGFAAASETCSNTDPLKMEELKVRAEKEWAKLPAQRSAVPVPISLLRSSFRFGFQVGKDKIVKMGNLFKKGFSI